MSSPTLSPEQLHKLDTEIQDLGFHSEYARRLVDLGLISKAVRHEDDGKYWKWYQDSTRDMWKTPASNSMLRTSPHYAKQLAIEQENKYRKFSDLISVLLARVDFRFRATTHEETQSTIKTVRKLIDRFLPKSMDKIGTHDGKIALKVLYSSSVDVSLARQIIAALPPGVTFHYSNKYKADFATELKSLTAPDLPLSETSRANLEKVMDKLHQLVLHKVSKEDRDKFVYTSPYTNLESTDAFASAQECEECKTTHLIRVPKNPRTGLPARYYSDPVLESVRPQDLKASQWHEYPPNPN